MYKYARLYVDVFSSTPGMLCCLVVIITRVLEDREGLVVYGYITYWDSLYPVSEIYIRIRDILIELIYQNQRYIDRAYISESEIY